MVLVTSYLLHSLLTWITESLNDFQSVVKWFLMHYSGKLTPHTHPPEGVEWYYFPDFYFDCWHNNVMRLGENSCIRETTFWLLSLDAVVAPPPFDRTMRDLDMQMNASHHLARDPIIFLSRNYIGPMSDAFSFAVLLQFTFGFGVENCLLQQENC